MAKYRKLPVIVEATQWFKNGDHPLDYSKKYVGYDRSIDAIREYFSEERKANNWEGDIVRYFRSPEVSSEKVCEKCGHTMHEHGWIDTLEGGHIVCVGDFIITGVKGEHYPCKPDIFKATYESVNEVNTTN